MINKHFPFSSPFRWPYCDEKGYSWDKQPINRVQYIVLASYKNYRKR